MARQGKRYDSKFKAEVAILALNGEKFDRNL